MKTTIVTPEEARAIARESYLYGFPLVETYKTLHKQAIAQASPEYKAPLNQLGHARSVATPPRFNFTRLPVASVNGTQL